MTFPGLFRTCLPLELFDVPLVFLLLNPPALLPSPFFICMRDSFTSKYWCPLLWLSVLSYICAWYILFLVYSYHSKVPALWDLPWPLSEISGGFVCSWFSFSLLWILLNCVSFTLVTFSSHSCSKTEFVLAFFLQSATATVVILSIVHAC